MFYDFTLTVPANTAKSAPASETMKLTTGIIHRVEIQFPSGCLGAVHVYLEHEGHQFLPSNPDGSFASDGYTIPIDEHYEIKSGLTDMWVRGWSDAEDYDHTITVRVGILPLETVSPFVGIIGALRKFLKLVGVG